eukprot:150038_1
MKTLVNMEQLCLLVKLLLLFLIPCTFSKCSFKSSWTVQNITLDLTAFQNIGLNLTGTVTDDSYIYYYSPCNNLQFPYASGAKCMITKQRKGSKNVQCVSQYTNTAPTISFNKKNNIIWNFVYNANISVQYICDPDASLLPPYMEIKQILEIYPNEFLMQIVSYYVCPGYMAPHTLGINECIWNDTSNLHILNLTMLYGTEILVHLQPASSDLMEQVYYVCQDLFHDTYSCGMFADKMKNQPWMIDSFWNATIIPTFNATSNNWTFLYLSNINWQISTFKRISWICNAAIDTYHVSYANVYALELESKYACPTICNFISNDKKHSLDLHPVSGQMIKALNSDLTYSYEYTPCSNYVQCNGLNVMAMRWDIQQKRCDPYLAKFEGNINNEDGYNLTYNINDQQWHFTYFNGEICQNNSE